MAVYGITLPSGGEYEIEHPNDDLSNDQVLQILSNQLSASTGRMSMAQNSSENSNVGLGRVADELTEGIALGTSKLGAAARRILPGALANAKIPIPFTDKTIGLPTSQDVEDLRGVRDNSGWATTGEVATDIGATMLPLAKGTSSAAKVLSRIPKLPAIVAGVAGAGAAGAGVGALTDPDSAKRGAATGALSSMGGEVLGRTLSRIVGGIIKPSAEAKNLMDKGIQPTVGQAADDSISNYPVKWLEERVANTPIVGGAVQYARNRARKGEFIREAFREALPPGGKLPDLKGTVNATLDQVEGQVRGKYAEIFKNVKVKIDSAFKSGMRSEVLALGKSENMTSAEVRELYAPLRTFLKRPRSASGHALAVDLLEVKGALADVARSASSPNVERAANKMSSKIDDFVGSHVASGSRDTYVKTRDAFKNLQRLKDAALKASSEGGHFSPDQLNAVVSKYPSTASLKKLAEDGSVVLENRVSNARYSGSPPTGPNLISSAITAGTTARPVQRALLGGYGAQRSAGDIVRRITPGLRQAMFESTKE